MKPHGRPRRRCAWWASPLMLAAAAAIGLAHSEPPPGPPRPADVSQMRVEYVYPPRWSWIHWWEANRDPYLQILRQGQPQRPEPQVLADYRRRAADALLNATQSPHWQARAAAALSLGQIGETTALPHLGQLATGDANARVRLFAYAAIGLLNTPDGEAFVLTSRPGGDAEETAATVALGLHTASDPRVIAALQRALRNRDAGTAIAAAWALRHKDDPQTRRILQDVLTESDSGWLVGESLLGLGAAGGRSSGEGLSQILLATDEARQTPLLRTLERREQQRQTLRDARLVSGADFDRLFAQYQQAFEEWQRNNPNRTDQPVTREQFPTIPITLGRERIAAAYVRASAAIALGESGDSRAVQPLLRVLAADADGWDEPYKGMAILALGRIGDPRAVEPLGRILVVTTDRRRAPSAEEVNSPLRGCAALALGLYARTVPTPQGDAVRPDAEAVCRLLAERLADPNETSEVRSAAALGLGLTGRTENLRFLQPASQAVAARDQVVAGYALLGRAMLGDRRILEPAEAFLRTAADPDDPAGMLARRAAVLALGLTGSSEAIPILQDAWHQSYHVNREVAVAMALVEAYNLTDPLVRVLQTSDNPHELAFAARCLGELFAAERPSRLAWLTNGSNYMLKNERLLPFQAMANEFLFDYLIPMLGDEAP